MLGRSAPTRRAALAVLVGAAVALATSSPATARTRELVKVGSTLALPPFEFVDRTGEIRGFEVDLVRARVPRI